MGDTAAEVRQAATAGGQARGRSPAAAGRLSPLAGDDEGGQGDTGQGGVRGGWAGRGSWVVGWAVMCA
ncbi:hypothetical protein [Streptomyces sp. NK08204]|uniref:hypothetical protein n=1 Tax=Streptomyces sp. NK08204 TaxID=2873260 RepID=UPI001CEDE176|nr:hypothetical protein [Streptomyces sp. NK08204]